MLDEPTSERRCSSACVFGQCDLSLLADFRGQSELLAAFINERPHLPNLVIGGAKGIRTASLSLMHS